MEKRALSLFSFVPIFVGVRAFIVLSLSAVVSVVFAASAAAETPPPKKKDAIFDENKIHQVSVFSYMQTMGGRGPSQPVLVTLNVKGPEALAEFCDNQSSVNEAVLQILSRDRGRAGKKAVLKSVKKPLQKAVNRVLAGKPVKKIETRSARTPAEFSREMTHTRKACKAIQG